MDTQIQATPVKPAPDQSPAQSAGDKRKLAADAASDVESAGSVGGADGQKQPRQTQTVDTLHTSMTGVATVAIGNHELDVVFGWLQNFMDKKTLNSDVLLETIVRNWSEAVQCKYNKWGVVYGKIADHKSFIQNVLKKNSSQLEALGLHYVSKNKHAYIRRVA
mmetsp:Transcript_263/g.809  ORF Transcript_263/g.809 Transcript_263/m.809 type:complete len:163 (-) Transcript_263:150-638(-)